MIQRESVVKVADNTGAKTAMVIGIPHGTSRKKASIGDVVIVVVKKASSTGSVSSGQIMRAVVIRTKFGLKRRDGTHLKFGDNSVVLLDSNISLGKFKPKGKVVLGCVPREIRDKGMRDITNICSEVI
ncbi:MAG: 50S ribosomal protein L14 [Candidatus Absconditabacterales bacterium]|nr:50S ribosomal protein L14 [Candidatus Absconditabacterales bacterium]